MTGQGQLCPEARPTVRVCLDSVRVLAPPHQRRPRPQLCAQPPNGLRRAPSLTRLGPFTSGDGGRLIVSQGRSQQGRRPALTGAVPARPTARTAQSRCGNQPGIFGRWLQARPTPTCRHMESSGQAGHFGRSPVQTCLPKGTRRSLISIQCCCGSLLARAAMVRSGVGSAT